MTIRRMWIVPAILVLSLIAVSLRATEDKPTARAEPDRAAVDRARDMVKMLDDLYKTAVVSITATYVKAQEKVPAARIAKTIFAAMDSKGYHSARLIDTTGKPINPANVAKSEFEKLAVDKLKGGADYFEEVGKKDGKAVLRAATRVPVVMKQCIACHPGLKEGELMGAIVYEVPIK